MLILIWAREREEGVMMMGFGLVAVAGKVIAMASARRKATMSGRVSSKRVMITVEKGNTNENEVFMR